MTRLPDITRDVCPMTTVKIGMALARLAPAEELQVMVREEALRNVIASLKIDGHRIGSGGPAGGVLLAARGEGRRKCWRVRGPPGDVSGR